jgi:tetratricopeptide (TPR) repeat protein
VAVPIDEFLITDEPVTRLTLDGWVRRLDALRAYFPDGFDGPLDVEESDVRLRMLQWTAQALNLHGHVRVAITMFERHDEECRRNGTSVQLAASLAQHGKSLRQAGRFRECDAKNREALALLEGAEDGPALLVRAVTLTWHGMALAHRGADAESEASFEEALAMFRSRFAETHQGVVAAFLAQRALWLGDPEVGLTHAATAWNIAWPLESDPTHHDKWGARKISASAARNRGEALVHLGRLDEGMEWLLRAKSMADETCFVEEIIPGLRAQAIAARLRGRFDDARDLLDQIWPLTIAGPYVMYECDARIESALVFESIGERTRADSERDRARELALADGSPFSFRLRA